MGRKELVAGMQQGVLLDARGRRGLVKAACSLHMHMHFALVLVMSDFSKNPTVD